mgnify:CR=1 FL=1
MAKQKKQPRPKAETPKGFRDYFGPEVTERADLPLLTLSYSDLITGRGFKNVFQTSATSAANGSGRLLHGSDITQPSVSLLYSVYSIRKEPVHNPCG